MRRGLGLVGLAALTAGCVSVPPPLPPVENPAAAWQARQTELKPIVAWNIQGRIAMRAGDKGWQATLYWMRDGQRQRIDLSGPLGRGHLQLVQDSRGATLRDADRKTWRAPNAEQLLYRTTGWRMPLDGLNYWVLGLPAPGATAHEELDNRGRLKTLVQSGWDIRFLEYARYGSFELPSKLFMTGRNASAPENSAKDSVLEVRLIVERWTLDGHVP
ncbi:MAG: lipoprotein insertase outer membrane protein LolB [Sulfuricaulis sp.]